MIFITFSLVALDYFISPFLILFLCSCYYKICRICGKLDRAENLTRYHFKIAHSGVAIENLRFLKVDEEPETGADEVARAFSLVGFFTPQP